ncbi:MAG: methyltransferase domain-containing protein [Calditrichia bacterium]
MGDKPQVEITGLEARFYDRLLNLLSVGRYNALLKKMINDLPLREQEVVMDLGAGTGKNAELILQRLNDSSRLYALEIGEEMRRQLQRRRQNDSRISILNQRIEEPFSLPEPATVALISFVLHGLPQGKRLKVVENAANNLLPGGRFCIWDYNHFTVDEAPWWVRLGVRKIECKPTEEFIRQDWPRILHRYGFESHQTRTYFRSYIRLLCLEKKAV